MSKSLQPSPGPEGSITLPAQAAILRAIVAQAVKGRTIFTLEGPSGVGKSVLLSGAAQRLLESKGFRGIAQLNAAQLRGEGLAIAAIYTQLSHLNIDSEAVVVALRKRLTDELPQTLRKLLGAALQDVAKALEIKAEKTVEVVRDIVTGKDAHTSVETTLKTLDDDNLRYFLKWYLDGLVEGGNTVIIAFDNFDAADQSLVSLVRFLIKEKPSGVTLLLANNTESGDNANWDRTLAHVRASSGWPVTIAELGPTDISTWFAAILGRNPTATELNEIVEKSHGRAVAVKLAIAERHGNGAGAVYPDYSGYAERTRRQLSADSRDVAELLAVLNRDATVPTTLLATAAANLGVKNLGAALDQLGDTRQVTVNDGMISLSHSVLRDAWRDGLLEPRLQQLGAAWFAAVSTFEPSRFATADVSGLIPAIAGPLLRNKPVDDIIQISRNLITSGQHGIGLELLDRTWSFDANNAEGANMLPQALIAAKTRLELGRYGEADDALRYAEQVVQDGSAAAMDTLLLRMKLALRRNAYSALAPLAVKLRQAGSNAQAQIEGELILNTAYRDSMDLRALESSNRRLLSLRGTASEVQQNEIHRALARACAKLGDLTLALDEANSAVATGLSLDSIRALGNCHLARAEVLRYREAFSESVAEYRTAIDIARAFGNRDSQIWSLLGMAAAQIRASDQDLAKVTLAEASALLAEPGYEHPLETAHLRLLQKLNGSGDFASSEILAAYSGLGIEWPREVLDEFDRAQRLPAAIPL